MNELAEALKPFWSAAKTSRELGTDENGLRRLADAGGVLEVQILDGVPIYPVAQVERASTGVRVKPGLAATFRELRPRDAWTVALAVLRIPAEELDGRTPIDAARDGVEPAELAAYGRVLAAELR